MREGGGERERNRESEKERARASGRDAHACERVLEEVREQALSRSTRAAPRHREGGTRAVRTPGTISW